MNVLRIFGNFVTENEQFIAMTKDAQNLYFHLLMRADNDGIISSPNDVLTATRSTEKDVEELAAAKLIFLLSNECLAIAHWNAYKLMQKNTSRGNNAKTLPFDPETESLDEEMFLSFWNAYPRKENMENTCHIWRHLCVDDKLFEKIMDAVQEQTYDVKWVAEDQKRFPLPADWLKQPLWKIH